MELGEIGVTANGYRNSWDDGNGLNLDCGDSFRTLSVNILKAIGLQNLMSELYNRGIASQLSHQNI